MKIFYLGHAGFLVETGHSIIIMDPWMSPTGAFDGGWFQFPCNHHLGDFVLTKASSGKSVYLYISHEHKDHFDIEFLKRLQMPLTFILPDFRRTLLKNAIALAPSQSVILCANDTQIELAKGESVTIYTEDSELNRDSAILFASGGKKFLNMNDCKIHDRLKSIKEKEGPIDVLACQFSGATWHPTCYDYSTQEYMRISAQKKISKFKATALAIEYIDPRVYIPSAGPACFLDPDLININFEKVNIFPRNNEIISYLGKRTKKEKLFIADMAPGDRLDADGWQMVATENSVRVEERDFEEYVMDYAARYTDFFAARKTSITPAEVKSLLEDLREEYQKKLDNFPGRAKIHRALYVGLTGYPAHCLVINFQEQTVGYGTPPQSGDYYQMTAHAYDIRRVLDKHITWEDFSLTFRMRLNRNPDIYQVLMQGFLLLEKEDLACFCDRITEIENRRERIKVEAGGCTYSVDRYCPHQGADLSAAWVEDQSLVCPRHRWSFDLEREGACHINSSSIYAIRLDPE